MQKFRKIQRTVLKISSRRTDKETNGPEITGPFRSVGVPTKQKYVDINKSHVLRSSFDKNIGFALVSWMSIVSIHNKLEHLVNFFTTVIFSKCVFCFTSMLASVSLNSWDIAKTAKFWSLTLKSCWIWVEMENSSHQS